MSDDNETRDRQPEGRRPAWQSGTPRGQERVVSYESDERYWTDYLRVALPVVGLLLMLGLLFWWTNSIIGDDQGSEPTATVVVTASNVATAPANTPENTVEPNLTPATVENDPTTPDDGGIGTETPGDEPTQEPVECDSEFRNGDPAEVTQDIRFRSEPSFDEEDPPSIAAGAEVEITSDCFDNAQNPETDDDEPFREVRVISGGGDVDDGVQGYVSEVYLELVEE